MKSERPDMKQVKSYMEKLLEGCETKDEETKRKEKRKRILGMIEAVKENPKSMMLDVLRGMYKNGMLEELNIDWEP